MDHKVIIILGRSASGKTTVVKELIDRGIGENLVTYTTREKRDNEINGIDYHFVTPEYFNGEDIQASFSVNDTWKYGVAVSEMKKHKVSFFCPISISYALDVAKSAISNGIFVRFIVIDIDKEERMKRLLSRGESQESINQRFDIEDKEGPYDINALQNYSFMLYTNKEASPTDMANVFAEFIN